MFRFVLDEVVLYLVVDALLPALFDRAFSGLVVAVL